MVAEAALSNQAVREVTEILTTAEDGDPRTMDKLVPLLYGELHELAQRMMANESPGHTLQPTALVHQAYLRLVGDQCLRWNSRGHFFAAAAEAMRRILVDWARSKRRQKRGGDLKRVAVEPDLVSEPGSDVDYEALDEALSKLADMNERMAQVVSLRFFAGLSVNDVSNVLAISPRLVKSEWRTAKAWLYLELSES